MQSRRWRHSGRPYSVRSCDLPSRSEIVFRPSLSAVSFVTATSFELTNGVGGSAVRFFSANPALASS